MRAWVTGFVERVAGQYRLAIASGGRREQIRSALASHPIEAAFELIVSADECATGKPAPAMYEFTMRIWFFKASTKSTRRTWRGGSSS